MEMMAKTQAQDTQGPEGVDPGASGGDVVD